MVKESVYGIIGLILSIMFLIFVEHYAPIPFLLLATYVVYKNLKGKEEFEKRKMLHKKHLEQLNDQIEALTSEENKN